MKLTMAWNVGQRKGPGWIDTNGRRIVSLLGDSPGEGHKLWWQFAPLNCR